MLDLVVLDTLRFWLGKEYLLADVNGPNITPGQNGLVVAQAFGQDVNARPLIVVHQGKPKSISSPWVGYVADESLTPLMYRYETVVVELETDETDGLIGLHKLIDDIYQAFANSVRFWTYPPPEGAGIYSPTWVSGEDTEEPLDPVGGHFIYKNVVEVTGHYEVAGNPPGLTNTAGLILQANVDNQPISTESFPLGGQ